jgi:hypothetical protein
MPWPQPAASPGLLLEAASRIIRVPRPRPAAVAKKRTDA